MALNQSAINVKVINGAEGTQFSQALNITSTVIVLFLQTFVLGKILLISSTVTGIINTRLILARTITASVVSSISTLLAVRFYYKILTVISTTTSTLVKNVGKLLTISVNCGIILSKFVYKTLTVLSTVSLSIIKSAISFTRYPVNRLIYAATKIRKVFYQ